MLGSSLVRVSASSEERALGQHDTPWGSCGKPSNSTRAHYRLLPKSTYPYTKITAVVRRGRQTVGPTLFSYWSSRPHGMRGIGG